MKIYLAGPEVFLRDAREVGRRKRELCAAFGHEGLFPLDEDHAGGDGLWRRIFDANRRMIERSGAVIANLTPFRGLGADAGTVLEVGFAAALGKLVLGYSNSPRDLDARTAADPVFGPLRAAGGRLVAADGMEVEAFGLADNLMIEGAIAASGGAMLRPHAGEDRGLADLALFEACLRALAARSEANQPRLLRA